MKLCKYCGREVKGNRRKWCQDACQWRYVLKQKRNKPLTAEDKEDIKEVVYKFIE